jgi:endogenous inhibitor of DNA gyrase (YacG/DUF329 family)
MFKPSRTYAGDPRWITARYSSRCPKCTKGIRSGDRGYYYPRTRSLYCTECGRTAEADFLVQVEAEEFYGGIRA